MRAKWEFELCIGYFQKFLDISEDYAKSTGFIDVFWKIWENFRRRGWMEGLAVPETAGNVLNHHQACFCEGFMLRQFAQLRLSSEIGRF